MTEDPELRKKTEETLDSIRERLGFVPVVNQVLSERPDLFLPTAEFSRALFEGDGAMDVKQRRLCAVAAATAICGEYCLRAQAMHAMDAGATREEVLEAVTIGSYMAMTRSQSYAFRKYAELFDIELE